MKTQDVCSLARRALKGGVGAVMVAGLVACANQQMAPSVAISGATALDASTGDQTLAQGVQMYQSAKYEVAETLFKAALMQGLSTGAETARAQKYLAFIYCTSKREPLCAAAFKQARQADPTFELSKAESGHPFWGPVYRKSVPPLRGKPGV
jgi:hypothetical protein